MDYTLLSHVFKCLEDLDGKTTNEREAHPHEVVVLDEFIQVDIEKLT